MESKISFTDVEQIPAEENCIKQPEASDNRGKSNTLSAHNVPICIEFEDISFKVKKKEKRTILNNASGIAKSGRLLGILGISGAGKTSLLNILSGRLRSNKNCSVTGKVKVNGTTKIKKEAFIQQVAYVGTDNHLYETLTVLETLELSARLRLSTEISNTKKKQFVDGLITALDLDSCRNTLVGGNKISGISSGERKRVAIANELIVNPSVLFLDEPTSGLDSYTALKLIQLLKDLAISGKTVITTLHQPSTEIYNLLDDIILVTEGTIVYCGPKKYAIGFFDKIGYTISENTNPADFFIECVAKMDKDEVIEYVARRQKEIVQEFAHENAFVKPTQKIIVEENKRCGFFKQCHLLTTKRSWKNYVRNPSTIWFKIVQIIFFAGLIGLQFYKLKTGVDGIFARTSALFAVLFCVVFVSVLNAITTFPDEKLALKVQLSNGMYSLPAYFVSKFIIEVPGTAIYTLIFSLISYWIVGFKNVPVKFLMFYFILQTAAQCGYFIGIFIGSIAPTLEIAMVYTSFVLVPSVLFSGFFMKNEDLLLWIRWSTKLNFFKYALDLVLYSQLTNSEGVADPGHDLIIKTNFMFWIWFDILCNFAIIYCLATLIALFVSSRNNVEGPLSNEEKIKTENTYNLA